MPIIFTKELSFTAILITLTVRTKKSFLTILGSKLLDKVFTIPKDKLTAMFSELLKSLDEKHMLISLPDGSINEILKEKNWNGQIAPAEGDYLYVVNSNLGGTKSELFRKKLY